MGEIAGTVLGAGGMLVGALGKKSAGEAKAAQLRLQSEAGKVAAVQTDVAYRERLSATLSNIDAIRSAQSANVDSPTSIAVKSEAEDRNNRARTVDVANQRIGARQKAIDAKTADRLANIELLAGGIGALGKMAALPNQIMRMPGMGG